MWRQEIGNVLVSKRKYPLKRSFADPASSSNPDCHVSFLFFLGLPRATCQSRCGSFLFSTILNSFQVSIHHHSHQFLECSPRFPTQNAMRLRWIPNDESFFR